MIKEMEEKDFRSIPLFDFALSNPPYQDAGNSAIFHRFQNLADKISHRTSFIYPADKWMTQSGKGLNFDEFSVQQIQSPFIEKISVYENSNQVFETIALHGGISIVDKNMTTLNNHSILVESFEYDGYFSVMDMNNENIRTLSTSNRMNHFVNKIMKDYSGKVLNNVLKNSAFYGIDSKYIERSDTYIKDSDYKNKEGYVKILTTGSSGKGGRVEWFWIPISDVKKKTDTIDLYKIAISPRNAVGYAGRSQHAFIYEPGVIFGDCRFCVNMFDNKEEANNFMKWMGTDVVRTLLVSSSRRVKNFGVNVPLPESFMNNSTIDFSQDVNEQLCYLYNLDENDREYMRNVVKSLGSFEMPLKNS